MANKRKEKVRRSRKTIRNAKKRAALDLFKLGVFWPVEVLKRRRKRFNGNLEIVLNFYCQSKKPEKRNVSTGCDGLNFLHQNTTRKWGTIVNIERLIKVITNAFEDKKFCSIIYV